MKVEELYHLFLKHRKISTDSRKVEKGDLFFALSGENFDGNAFAKEALHKGASYAVIDNPGYKTDERCIVVNNSLKTLQALAKYHRGQLNIPVLGITGSNGKTTTKELVMAVLKSKHQICGTQGNLNNHIGVPLTLLSIGDEDEIAVIEMGANHVGEIGFLCEIAQPGYGIITNVGKAHLEGFGSFEGVKKTKKELYDYVSKAGGKLIINGEDTNLVMMAGDTSRITYGYLNPKAHIQVKNIRLTPFLELTWGYANHQQEYTIQTQLPGKFHWSNVMNAVSAGLLFDIDPELINKAIAAYTPSNNRSQFIQTSDNLLFLDAYNANPSSMQAAMEYFFDIEKPNKMMIVGEMFELGHTAKEEHQKLIKSIEENQNLLDGVLLTGKSFEDIPQKKFRHFSTTEKLMEYLRQNKPKNKTIFIKGSRKNKLEILTNLL